MAILSFRVIHTMAIRHIDLLTDNHLLIAQQSIRTNVTKWLHMQSSLWASGDGNTDDKATHPRTKGRGGVRKPITVSYFHILKSL